MKKLFGFISIMAVLLMMTAPLYSQIEKIVVNKSDLTSTQLMKIETDAKITELQQKLETYGNWVGVGGEIGTAVKEGLTAVVDVADKFGKTDVGKFTLIMVAYKIMGRDFIRIGVGIIFAVIFTIFFFVNFKRNFTERRIVIEDNGWRFWLPKKYQIVSPNTYEGYEFVKWANVLILFGGFAIIYAIMFA